MATGVGGTRRVKLYSFTENLRWEDMGTGHVSMSYIDRLQALTLVVSSEEDGEDQYEVHADFVCVVMATRLACFCVGMCMLCVWVCAAGSTLLESKITPDRAYQKQEVTVCWQKSIGYTVHVPVAACSKG